MTIVHLHRPTRLPRKSISAANLVCNRFPENEAMHKLIWGIINKRPRVEYNFETLNFAVEELIKLIK